MASIGQFAQSQHNITVFHTVLAATQNERDGRKKRRAMNGFVLAPLDGFRCFVVLKRPSRGRCEVLRGRYGGRNSRIIVIDFDRVTGLICPIILADFEVLRPILQRPKHRRMSFQNMVCHFCSSRHMANLNCKILKVTTSSAGPYSSAVNQTRDTHSCHQLRG
ncbi:hypothetical protein Ab1vBOLIVR4_gp36c [Agrobacterium phage OLIVR4]|nr:hypothetical protein Ab1vBOLIVR4_gp36c [Agrobacterium phage OLIVR4]